MAILNVQTVQTGLVGVLPSLAYIYTSDPEATVLTTGYLNKEVQNGVAFSMPCMAAVSTQETPTSAPQVGWYQIAHVGANWSLVPTGSPGDVILPTVANYLAHFTNTTGTLSSAAASVINLGNIQAGISGTAGYLASFPSTAAKGSLRVTAVANTGDTLVTISNALHGQASVYSIPDSGATTANFILSKTTGTQHITVGALQVDAGALISGLSTGGFVGKIQLFPTTTTTGSLTLQATPAGGNYASTITNAAFGQAVAFTIPDPGAATASFLLNTSSGGQSVAGGFTVSTGNLAVSAGTITSSGAITSTAGNITSGSSGDAGTFISFPATATNGTLIIAAANAGGAFNTTISNGAMLQSTVYTIPDVGAATGFLNPQSVTANLTPASVTITKDVTLGFAALAAGGTVAVQAALATASFKVRNIFVNYGASGLSGGGGDRLITLTDGTTVYNNAGITAALLGTPINTVWGGTGNPLAATVNQSTATVAGQALRFVYSGGTTDYTAGSVVVTVTYERVA